MRKPVSITININVPTGTVLDASEREVIAKKFRSAVEPICAAIEAGSQREQIGPFETGTCVLPPQEPKCRVCGRLKSEIERELGYSVEDQSADVSLAKEATFEGHTGVVENVFSCGCVQRAERAALESRDAEIRRRRALAPEAIETTGSPQRPSNESQLREEVKQLTEKLAAMEGNLGKTSVS